MRLNEISTAQTLSDALLLLENREAFHALCMFVGYNNTTHAEPFYQLKAIVDQYFPPKPQEIYRGTKADVGVLGLIAQGKPITLKASRPVRSWTSDPVVAFKFSKVSTDPEVIGLLLESETDGSDIVLDLSNIMVREEIVEAMEEYLSMEKNDETSQAADEALMWVDDESEIVRLVQDQDYYPCSTLVRANFLPAHQSAETLSMIKEYLQYDEDRDFIDYAERHNLRIFSYCEDDGSIRWVQEIDIL